MLRTILVGSAAAASLLVSPGFAQGALEISQTQSASTVDRGGTITYTVVVNNTGSVAEDANVGTLALEAGKERPADNPYSSAVASQGSCAINDFESSIGTYRGIDCPLGALAPGASAQIVATAEVNESVDHVAGLVPCFGGNSCGFTKTSTVSTLVNAVTEIDGDKGIKLGGLPTECTDKDFTLKARVQDKARKITISLKEFSDGGDSSFTSKIATVRGKKQATASIDASRFESGPHELKVSAKLENGAKLKSEVTFHRC